MSGKKVVVSTDTTKKKQIQDNPDGSTVTTITTTTVEKYSDGTQSTKTQVETHKTTPERKEKDSESPPGPPGSLVEAAKQSGNQPPDPLGIQSQSEGSKGLGKTEQSFLDGALKATNELRAKHSSPPLVLDVELCNLAQVWTDKLAGQQKMEHSTTEYGENCYWSSLNLTDGRRPVESWYSEIKDHNFNKFEPQKGTGHFTQLIWKATKRFGIARSVCRKGSTYVVANYDPAGNFVGQYEENVLKPK